MKHLFTTILPAALLFLAVVVGIAYFFVIR